MKRLTFFVAAILLFLSSFAQQKAGNKKTATAHGKSDKRSRGRCPLVFLNISTGLNNNTGIAGVGADLAFSPQGSVDAGIGYGWWGPKAYFGAKYYSKPCHGSWAFGGGLTYSAGNNNYKNNVETVYGTTELVTLHLSPMANAFAAAYKYWNIGKRHNQFYLELGWSLRLLHTTFTQTAGDPLSNAAIQRMNAQSPGGIIVSTGFAFGMPRGK